jgi:autotransporter-associated beta strand protein
MKNKKRSAILGIFGSSLNSLRHLIGATAFALAALASVQAAEVNLTTFTVSTQTGGPGTNNSGTIANAFSGFTSTQLVWGSGVGVGNSSSPSSTFNATFANATASAAAALTGNLDITFTTVISAGWDVNVDAISGFVLGKTSGGPGSTGLYWSTNSGTTWNLAGNTATTATTGTDLSSTVNSGAGGLTLNPVEFNNTTGTTPLTVSWAIPYWGNTVSGRSGLGKGSFILKGNILASALGNQYWTGGISGTWDTTTVSWYNTNGSGAADAFTSGDNAYFTNATPTAITVTAGGISAGTVTVTNAGGLTLGGGTLTASGINQNGTGTLTINNTTTLSGGLVQNSGFVIANASNAITGGALINGGTLQDTTAGSVKGAITLNGGSFDVTSASSETNLSSIINVGTGGGTLSVDGTNTVNFTGNVTGAQNTMTISGTGTTILSGTVGANKNGVFLNENAGSTVYLALTGLKTNDLAGGVINGSLVGTSSIISIDPMNPNIVGSGTLTGSGTLIMNGGSVMTTYNTNSPYNNKSANLALPVVLSSGTTNNFYGSSGGNNLTVSGPISGSGALQATMSAVANKLTLSGTNTFTGGIQVNAGYLAVTGSNASSVTMNGAGATIQSALGQTGTIGGFSMTNGGNMNVGGGTLGVVANSFGGSATNLANNTASAGGLLISGGADFTSQTGIAANLLFSLTNTATAITDYSQLSVGGLLNYGGANLYINLNNTNAGFAFAPASLHLINPNGGVAGSLNSVTFSDYGLSSTNAIALSFSGTTWTGLDGTNSIAFDTSTGVLAFNGGSVPEPSTCALLGLSLTAFTIIMIRRRRSNA